MNLTELAGALSPPSLQFFLFWLFLILALLQFLFLGERSRAACCSGLPAAAIHRGTHCLPPCACAVRLPSDSRPLTPPHPTTPAGMAAVHLTPNLEASNAMAGFTFALVNVFCGFLRPYPVSPARAEKRWVWHALAAETAAQGRWVALLH